MSRIRLIHWRRLAKIFESDGWRLDRISGDHLIYVKDGFIRPIVIPKDKEIQVFIILNNLKTAKISRDKYLQLLKEV